MLENDVEFGSPDKRFGGFLNSALIALFYVAVLAGLLHRFPVNFSQNTPGQLRNRKSGGSGGSKVSEQGEVVMFSDVAGVDEAKEELEEIVEEIASSAVFLNSHQLMPTSTHIINYKWLCHNF